MKYHKALINNTITLFLFLGLLLLSGCKKSSVEEQTINNEIEQEVIFNLDKIKEECIQLATSYQSIYRSSEKIISQYIPYEISLPQESIDEIEEYFISKGYSVINSDRKYPSYLENTSAFYQFYEDSKNGKEVEQKIISITSNGGMLYTILKSNNEKKYQAIVSVQWNEDNEPFIDDAEYHPINDWELINHTDFYYLTPLKGPMYDVYSFIRLKEVDKSLYDMNEKYILPIGYIFNNMFITDWTYPKYDGLCFNDLLEAFYKKKYNQYFSAEEYPKVNEKYEYSSIPASLFEETIMPYFDISLTDFREKCLYNKELDSYPWQEIGGENFSSYPNIEPEVVKYQENDDGTITLTIDVRCYEYKTSRLFSHEVIIKLLDNGEYQYLSNRVIDKSDYELPKNQPRLPMQRNHQ